jgi:L-aspartate oxidase
VVRYLVDFDLQQLDRRVADFVVVGSGVAGLFAAHKASQFGRVILLTKDLLEGNTRYAQGGVAAAVGDDDSWQEHLQDTLEAGAGLCDPEAVSVLVQEGPDRVRDLMQLGARFDRQGDSVALTREGGHRRRRVLHAGGDATGKEIEETLARAVAAHPDIEVVSSAFAVDLLTVDGECHGVLAFVNQQLIAYLAKATILATGGAGQVFAHTTNSPLVTGDGMAMAYRAGAEMMDMEFFQFHPTGLYIPGAPRALITEAVRGEGAYLLDRQGQRFMLERHPLAELAPRDVVARAMVQVMMETGSEHLWLDLRHMQHIDLPRRFPTVFATCQRYGLDLRRDLIPVSPVAHYFMGGIRVNYQGRTNLRGLYACGEAACLGLHGANRLASNSLLDGLVFGHRIAICAHRYRLPISDQQLRNIQIRHQQEPRAFTANSLTVDQIVKNLQQTMWQGVGLTRSAQSLQQAEQQLLQLTDALFSIDRRDTEWFTAVNLLTVALLICQAAALRTESRGGHYRLDYPDRDDANWKRHIVLQRNNRDGSFCFAPCQ